ncbi:MFS transporter [Purpureocillium lilacinum]|uniref:MFS transporter n=1 Tax=Purpureocillium lilacinum TaxID=33203 RepID=A0A2U3EHA0_PURLI|nr:MFS transporter [Purpureocillium lilacinum]
MTLTSAKEHEQEEVDQVERCSAIAKEHDGIVPGANEAQRQFFLEFASKDEEWRLIHEKKLLRRIDLHLMPFLVIMYLLNFLDRSNLAQARQGTLEKDLGMKGTDFNLATSIFFVGYLLMQLPSNLLITRVRPSLYLATSVLLWGVVSTCNAATHNFTQLVVTRFFLGFVEAPFFPGAVFLMSSWYTRAELTRRVAWFYCGNALANMFGGLIAYGVLKDLSGNAGIAGWRWLFIVEGVVTIGVSFVAAFVLPDYPATTRWLSDEEKAFAAWRLLVDVNEADELKATTIWQGVKLALLDYRLYIFVLFTHLSILSMTFQYFFPSIVQTLGYDKLITLLLTVPAWFATFIVAVFVNWTAAHYNDRSIHIFCLMILATAGNVIATASTSTGARFFAMFLMPVGAVSTYTLVVGWVANSFPRPLVKRSAVIAIANMIGNTASIYGSYMYDEKTGPQYVPGGSANAVISFLVAVLAIVLRYIHKWENKKLERADREAVEEDGEVARDGPVGFRYIY